MMMSLLTAFISTIIGCVFGYALLSIFFKIKFNVNVEFRYAHIFHKRKQRSLLEEYKQAYIWLIDNGYIRHDHINNLRGVLENDETHTNLIFVLLKQFQSYSVGCFNDHKAKMLNHVLSSTHNGNTLERNITSVKDCPYGHGTAYDYLTPGEVGSATALAMYSLVLIQQRLRDFDQTVLLKIKYGV